MSGSSNSADSSADSSGPLSSEQVAPPDPHTDDLVQKLPSRGAWLMLALASVSSAMLFFAMVLPFLGAGEIYQVSEGREGVVVDEMLRTGEVILPLRHGTIVPSKPMLNHWVSAVAARLHGSSDEFSLRLPSTIAGTLLLLMLSWTVGRTNLRRDGRYSGAVVGAVSSILVALSIGYYRLSSDGRVDMFCLALSTSSIFVLYRQLVDRSTWSGEPPAPTISDRRLAWSAGLAGLAVMAKGPIGLVLPALAVGPYLFAAAGPRSILRYFRWPLLLAFVVPAPWYLLAAFKGHSGFVARQIFFENFGRFFGASGISAKPFWFYLPHLFLIVAPLTELMLGGAIVAILPSMRDKFAALKGRLTSIERQQVFFCLIWIASQLFFFSASSGKRASYLVAFLPPMAIVCALFGLRWIELIDSSPESKDITTAKLSSKKIIVAYLVWAAVPLVLIGASTGAYFLQNDLGESSSSLVRTITVLGSIFLARPTVFAVFVLLLVVPGMLAIRAGVRHSRPKYLYLSAALLWTLIIALGVPVTEAVRGKTHGYKALADTVTATAPTGEKITFIKTAQDESFDGFFFYVKRRIEITDSLDAPADPGIYLARNQWIQQQSTEWRDRVHQLASGRRLVDSKQQEIVLFRLESPKPAEPSSGQPSLEN